MTDHSDYKDYERVKVIATLDGSDFCTLNSHRLMLSQNYAWKTCDPVLTVEIANKWYRLHLIVWEPHEPELDNDYGSDLFKVYGIHYGHLEKVAPEGVSPYLDHAPNPLCVNLFARRNGYHLDSLADELIVGRWQREYVETSAGSCVMECDRCEGTGEVKITDVSALAAYVKNPTCRACKGHGVLKPGA